MKGKENDNEDNSPKNASACIVLVQGRLGQGAEESPNCGHGACRPSLFPAHEKILFHESKSLIVQIVLVIPAATQGVILTAVLTLTTKFDQCPRFYTVASALPFPALGRRSRPSRLLFRSSGFRWFKSKDGRCKLTRQAVGNSQ
jgi:hypothetical protein